MGPTIWRRVAFKFSPRAARPRLMASANISQFSASTRPGWTSCNPLTSFAPCRYYLASKTTTSFIANFVGRCRRATISAWMSATAGRNTSPTASPFCTSQPDGRDEHITYGWLRETSNRLANVLRAHGIARGDRVAILLPQSPRSGGDPYRHLQARRAWRCRWRCCSAPTRFPIGCRIPAPRRWSPTRGAGERIAEITEKSLPALKLVLSLDGAATARLVLPMRWRMRLPISRRSTHPPTIRR